MKKMTTAACALALGFAWAAAPAMAQTTPQDKADQKAQKIEQKGEDKAQSLEQKADKTRAKADEKADKVRDKAEGTTDSTGNKMERAWDKTKEKTKEAKDKIKDSLTGKNSNEKLDVRGAQQALRDKGFDPGPVDGMMGPRTSAAVREFQTKEGLTATGTLDSDTRARLMAASSSDSNIPAASPASENNPKTKQTN
jgi:Putative peptidoglycan binding domain